MTEYQTFEVQPESGMVVVKLKSVWPPFRDEIHSFLSANRPNKMVLNFRDITQLLSSGLYGDDATIPVLLELRKKVQTVILCELSAELREAFEIIRLDQLFEIKASV